MVPIGTRDLRTKGGGRGRALCEGVGEETESVVVNLSIFFLRSSSIVCLLPLCSALLCCSSQPEIRLDTGRSGCADSQKWQKRESAQRKRER